MEITREQNEYKRADAILAGRRAESRRALGERHARAFGAAPELERVENEITEAGLKHGRLLLSGAESAAGAQAGLADDIGALTRRRDAILKEHGLPGDYLTPAPYCRICGDTGYVADARGVPERCECYKQTLYDCLQAASNIMAAGAAGFDIFNENLYSDKADEQKYRSAASPRENILKVRDSSLRFVKSFHEGGRENLYFFGKPGTGKTFMAASIALELMKSGVAVLYMSAPNLFNIITEHRMMSVRDAGYRDVLYRQILGCKLLIIDDLGLESMTGARYSEFIILLNARITSSGYSTIISTNLILEELQAAYDERVLSRILGTFHNIRFFGDDIRLKRGV